LGKFIDLTGQRFGRLVVVERAENNKNGSARWNCKCDCGEYVLIKSTNELTSGKRKSCGCLNSECHVIDLVGQEFGRWRVIERSVNKIYLDGHTKSMWLCECACGKRKIVASNSLRSGHSKSCGCLKSEMTHNRKFIDLTGEVFGRLKILGLDHIGRRTFWKCLCECGKIKIINGGSLKNGTSTSCGCLQKEIAKNLKIKDFGDATKNSLYVTYLGSARKRDLNFSIDRNLFFNLVQLNCAYCGDAPKNKIKNQYGNGDYTYNGLDRIDNSKGYIEDNVVPCCRDCNNMKKTMGQQEFLDHIEKIHNYQKEKNETE
jgi:hypothetical protein